MILIDETGNRYGCLVVLERAENKGKEVTWRCSCDCGRSVVVLGYKLRGRNKNRCGTRCLNKFGKYWDVRSEAGNRYGSLVVVDRDMSGQFQDGAYKQIRWWCKCDCGTVKSIRGTSLRKGDTASCGCARKIAYGEAGFRIFYRATLRGAIKRGYAFNLTEGQVRETSSGNCFYCGKTPSQISKNKSDNGHYLHNGIDRVDNERGYEIDNVVSCCVDCNLAKHARDVFDFKSWITSVYSHWASKS